MKKDRRDFIKKGTSLAAALSLSAVGVSALPSKNDGKTPAAKGKVKWPILEGPDTPKIIINMPAVARPWTSERIRMLKQVGSDYTLMGGPKIPWAVSQLEEYIAPFKAEGVIVYNLMIEGFQNIIRGTAGRDEEIEQVKASIIAAGKVGIPVVEYNWYAAGRLGEGYDQNEPGRGGAGYSAYDEDRISRSGVRAKDLQANERSGPPIGKEALWANITHFLKEVIPVAEKAGVRMALHPNDPPIPVVRGSAQIMITFNDWKRLLDIVDSPSNGMTFDCGVTTEIGEDPVEVIKYMAARDRINHVHYRNCVVAVPSKKYVETFPDNGQIDMYAVMRELVRQKYTRGIFPEHPRVLLYDKDRPGELSGYMYNMAYARAMFQAVIYNEGNNKR